MTYTDEARAASDIRPSQGRNDSPGGRMIDTGRNRLTAELDQLEKMLAVLSDKIDPVLAPAKPSPSFEGSPEPPEMSAHAMYLNAAADRVGVLVYRLGSTIERIDL